MEKKFWKVEESYAVEIKGRLLLSKKALTSPKKREFVEEILSLCKLNQVVGFAVGLKRPESLTLGAVPPPDTFRVMRELVDRVETMMLEQFSNEIAAMVSDSQEDKNDKERALEFGNYPADTLRGRAVTHVADTPLFASSNVTKGLQIADLFAYAIAQQNLNKVRC